ncbi:ABC transporter permease [Ruminiclostridium josui]|uniref:ABC transporter permease n=1 Tax=Ruminiclostridium josui TaxID=1499 RepID=UPI00046739F9|nr:FtsX-like permease family protein [Ruminiclostridium josui]
MIVWKISICNIKERSFRSVGILLLTAFAVFIITVGLWFKIGLQNGIDSITERLGADIMLVPVQVENDFEGVLLSGKPSTFYISNTVAEELPQIDGIKDSTPQIFISTFNSEHCAALVQIIGYDPETDFVIKPWLSNSNIFTPKYGQIVVGANIKRTVGEKMLLFSKEYEVVANLGKTGMGFDNCVFVTLDTAQTLLDEYQHYKESSPLPKGKGVKDVVSTVMANISDDYNIVDVQKNINEHFRRESIKTITNKALISSTSKNLGLVKSTLTVISVGIWLFAVFALVIIWTVVLNERKREFGILRAVGAKNNVLIQIMISEGLILSLTGAVIGASTAVFGVSLYNKLIEKSLSAAYLPPSGLSAVTLIFGAIISGVMAGTIAVLFSTVKISKMEVLNNIKDSN